MDFYDSIYQYDLEIENKITKRLNKFLKFINILKNENPLNISNTGDTKYTHITNILEEIKSSTKFKNRLFINKKKNLLLRMNNKTKVNSKYYIYAKNMSQNNHKIDIIEVKNNLLKKDEILDSNNNDQKEKSVKFCEIFNQKNILGNNKDFEEQKEKDNIEILKSDTNKIVCDLIKQTVKNNYKRKLNEIIFKNQNENNSDKSKEKYKNKDKESSEMSFNKSKDIKNNNYVKSIYRKKRKEECIIIIVQKKINL